MTDQDGLIEYTGYGDNPLRVYSRSINKIRDAVRILANKDHIFYCGVNKKHPIQQCLDILKQYDLDYSRGILNNANYNETIYNL